MKKYIFLIPLFLLILIPNFNVNALTYTRNEELIEVNKDNFIYYAFQTYKEKFEEYNHFVYICYSTSNSQCRLFFFNDDAYLKYNSMRVTGYFQLIYNYEGSDYYAKDYIGETSSTKEVTLANNVSEVKYLNFDFSGFSLTANISVDSLNEYFSTVQMYNITYYINNEVYKTLEVEKGSSHTLIDYDYNSYLYNFSGWNVETTDVDLNNITSNVEIRATLEEKIVNPVYINNFPITKEEFYVLLCLISILIMFEFLRFVFPFKGGKNL